MSPFGSRAAQTPILYFFLQHPPRTVRPPTIYINEIKDFATLLLTFAGDHGDLMRILKREIPLKTLQLWTGVPHTDEHWHLSQTLINVAENYTNTLGQ